MARFIRYRHDGQERSVIVPSRKADEEPKPKKPKAQTLEELRKHRMIDEKRAREAVVKK